jgi:Tfp pilus assembly protein PilF
MSLINEMLRDLESRRSAEQQQRRATLKGVFVTEGTTKNRHLLFILVLAILLLGFVLKLLISGDQSPATVPQAANTPHQQSIAINKVARPESETETIAPSEAKAALPEPAVVTPSVDPGSLVKPAPKVTATNPPRLIALQPDALTAAPGFQTLQLQGEAFVPGSQVEIRWLGGGTTLTQRIKVINAGQMEIAVRTGSIEDLWELRVRSPDGQLSNPLKLAIQTTPPLQPPDEKTQMAAPAEVEAEEPPGESSVEKRIRPFSTRERAEQSYRKAHALLQSGKNVAAEETLRQALNLNRSHHASREALVGLLISEGRQIEALELLQQGLQLQPGAGMQAMLAARLLMEQQRTTEAIAILEKTLATRPQATDYLAFLAALYQREGQYQQSAQVYQRALKGNPGNGTWLMGLGISLEKLNDRDGAMDAYQQALESRQLSKKLRRYVNQQLEKLQGSASP